MGKNTLHAKLKTTEVDLCLLACDILDQLGLTLGASAEEVCRALGVTPAEASAQYTRLRDLLDCDKSAECARIKIAVLRYRVEHPGCWCDDERTAYSDELRSFVLALAERAGIGAWISLEEFAQLCHIPLSVLTAWWVDDAAASTGGCVATGTPSSSPEAVDHGATIDVAAVH